MDNPVPHKILPELQSLEISSAEFDSIRDTLRQLRQFNLDAYKDKCVKRRIAIRVRATNCTTVKDYCELLRSCDCEVDKLLKVLTIHVSQFFRNRSAFEKLQQEIIPYLFSIARQDGRTELNCWSVGCATGEEPYSLAMIFADHFAEETKQLPVRIYGTDVDEATLHAAREARYVEERLAELPEKYKNRYFRDAEGKYVLSDAIKQMVEFNRGDISHDNIFQESELILCRNMLIYFEREQQETVIRNFARVLRPGGILVLGKSESLFGECRKYFQTVCPVERIYRVAAA
jgi:chemotaxis protein methyltransferase CheR